MLSYDAGSVDPDFPAKREDPKEYGIVPLWERIAYMTIGNDTLDQSVFSEKEWSCKGSTYTLTIE